MGCSTGAAANARVMTISTLIFILCGRALFSMMTWASHKSQTSVWSQSPDLHRPPLPRPKRPAQESSCSHGLQGHPELDDGKEAVGKLPYPSM